MPTMIAAKDCLLILFIYVSGAMYQTLSNLLGTRIAYVICHELRYYLCETNK